ncbi:MAG: hypothetical protein K8R90_05235 [Candidatus Cloacimonetes bacterium]|nr:hypothetical protein [Candidatus Cloacimonadota bacterium]
MRTIHIALDERINYVELYTDEKYLEQAEQDKLEATEHAVAALLFDGDEFAYMIEDAHANSLQGVIDELRERPIEERFDVPALNLLDVTLRETLKKWIEYQAIASQR